MEQKYYLLSWQSHSIPYKYCTHSGKRRNHSCLMFLRWYPYQDINHMALYLSLILFYDLLLMWYKIHFWLDYRVSQKKLDFRNLNRYDSYCLKDHFYGSTLHRWIFYKKAELLPGTVQIFANKIFGENFDKNINFNAKLYWRWHG